jgi:hypothetical protein
MSTTIKLRRDTASRWRTADPVLFEGEPGLELDTGQFKIGDGVSRWTDLDYFVPNEADLEIPDGPAPAPPPPEGSMDEHVEDESPHPIYDDGPSLALLYENAKV